MEGVESRLIDTRQLATKLIRRNDRAAYTEYTGSEIRDEVLQLTMDTFRPCFCFNLVFCYY